MRRVTLKDNLYRDATRLAHLWVYRHGCNWNTGKKIQQAEWWDNSVRSKIHVHVRGVVCTIIQSRLHVYT